MRTPPKATRILIVLCMLTLAARAGSASTEWRAPAMPVAPEPAVPIEPVPAGVDPCGCLRELRSCLITATLNLGRCLSQAHNPAGHTLCYLKFELEVLLCLDRASTCAQTCIP